jgi:AcrR family transcriptional regulator
MTMNQLSSNEAAESEQEFTGWLQQGKLPHIKTGVQQRSARTAYALLQSGFALLRTKSFDALSIEELCATAGATAGAFYGRFDDKQSFFAAMQALTCLRSEAALREFVASVRQGTFTLDEVCRMVVALSVERYRSNLGIYRAALQHAGEGAWAPFRRLGDSYRRALTEILSPHLPRLPKAVAAMRIQFAYQVIVGTLVHATLNDPGPVHLQDDALVDELTAMVLGYLAPRAPG